MPHRLTLRVPITVGLSATLVHVSAGAGTASVLEKNREVQGERRQCAASERAMMGVGGPFNELVPLRLAMNFNLPFRNEDQPNFFDACAGVGPQLGAIVIVTGYADFDNDLGGCGVLPPEVAHGALDHSDIGLWFGIRTCDGLFTGKKTAWRQSGLKQTQ